MLAFCRQRQQYWTAPFIFRPRCRETAPGGGRLESTRWDRPCLMPGQAVRNPALAYAPAKKRFQPCLYGTRQWPNPEPQRQVPILE